MQKNDYKLLKIVIGTLIAVDILAWSIILFPAEAKDLELYFLDVGQGDSSLALLPGGARILVDGGPINGKLQENLEKILPVNDRYIDLVMISHPQIDHFGGLIEILKNYKVGAVLTSDQTSEQPAWLELENIIKEKGIRRIFLAAGDKIKYENSYFDVLSPRPSDFAKDVNDLSLVMILNHSNVLENIRMKVFFGGDISAEKEKQLADLYNVDVDILKVSHHGSKFSSNSEFLKEASPAISVIEVGKNSYGHPTKEVLGRLASVGSQIFRVDQNGIVQLKLDKSKIKVYTNK